MDLEKIKEIIVSSFIKIYLLIKNNKNIVALIVLIIGVILFAYYYSEKNRVSKKLNYITNALAYDSPRLQIDYCGQFDTNVDKLLVEITELTGLKNGIKIINNPKKIDLWNYNLSSEYVVEIRGKTDTTYDSLINQPYKIKNIDPTDSSILYFSNDTKFPATDPVTTKATAGGGSQLVELTFYKINPSSRENPYKYKKLCEYYVSSSYNSFLIGKQILDYLSVEMFKKVLYFGARYIEIPIYDKELKNETIPVIFHGFGNNQLTLNYITVEEAIDVIGSHAFNNRFLDNANDPLFIFLNIKTKNIQTLNKVYDILLKYLSKYLLPRSYNHINIAYSKICELAGKCVLLSSDGYKNSKLDELINSSTNSGHLKRITYNEVLLDIDEMMGPKLKLNSNKIKFVSDNVYGDHISKTHFRDHIEIVDNNINLFNYGLTKGDGVYISGSKKSGNNSGEYIFPIDTITKNKIIFNKEVFLTNDDIGDYITIEVYDKHIKVEVLEEYNKNNLTIVIPDSTGVSTNYNFKDIMYKGCQFVAMNFHHVDQYMKDYFSTFIKQSIVFKPKVLINSINIPKSVSINTMVPSFDTNIVLDINYNFMDKLRNNRDTIISPLKNDTLRLISGEDGRTAKFSLYHTIDNSKIEIVAPLNKKSGYVSFKNKANRYLTFKECGCYLYFTKAPEPDKNIDNSVIYKFNDSASFISLNSPIAKSGYNSFGVVKSINDKERLYYLKIRSSFNSRKKLFVKNVKDYEIKFRLTSGNDPDKVKVVVLKPKFNSKSGFFPVGDIVVFEDRMDKIEIEDSVNEDGFVSIPTYATYIRDQYTGPTVTGPTTQLGSSLVCPDGYSEEDGAGGAGCYEDCPEDYTVVGNNCVSKTRPTRKVIEASADILKPEQNFSTQLFSGAVDKPRDYELVWDNEDVDDDKKANGEMSIWNPIPNDGFMEMGCVFVNGYKKPSINDVVCVSVDYIKEESIHNAKNEDTNDSYGNPIYYNETSQLALWNITNHDYVKAYPFVKKNDDDDRVLIPNMVEFKMYDFITDEKDYFDRLYLDSNLSTTQEKESTLFKISFDSIVESGGNDVYDYLMKLENSNGKLISYTPSENGSKMCMALPQPYWSSFYDSVSTNIDNSAETGIAELDTPKLKFESCKSRDYFGTNWNMYDDNTLRLEGNPEACMTYNGDPKLNISISPKDENNYLFLDKCVNDDSKNQKFEFVDNNIRVLTNTDYDPNACLTHTPEDGLRLEECGDKKFSVISKWNGKVASIDKCNRDDAEAEMKQIGSMEVCNDLSFYVVFLTNGFDHSHQEYCSYDDAKEIYDKEKDNYPRGIGIVNGKKILLSDVRGDGLTILNNYMIQLLNVEGNCRECQYPSKVLCVENGVVDSEYTHFENDTEKKEISDHCRTLKNNNNFKCSRGFRQKFTNNIRPSDYCIDYYKEVYLYVYSSDQHRDMGFNPSRPSTQPSVPVDNLLGETYDKDNYHMFIKGIIAKSKDSNKFKLVFDTYRVNGISNNSIDMFKNSNDIILAYAPSYDDIKIGTKVLAKLGTPNSENHFENDDFKINKSHVKWMAVVIDKLDNNEVEVMFSINSYDLVKDTNTNRNRPFSESNIRKIYNVNDLVLLAKAPLCI